METTGQYIRSFSAAGLAALFACTVLMPDTLAWAAPRKHPPRPVVRHHHPKPPPVRHHPRPVIRYRQHRISPLLPLGFTLLTIAGLQYYYHQGRYYRHIENRYVVAPPPLGGVVVELPAGHVSFWSNGVQYFYYGDAYYKRVPRGYIVVDPPYEASSKPPVDYRAATPAVDEVTVIAPMLNVRSGPGTNNAITFQAPQGTTLEIHGTAPEWLFVKLPTGEFGWVMKKFTNPESAPKAVPAEG